MTLLRKAITTICATLALTLPCVASFGAHRVAGPEGLADGPGIWVNMWNYPQGDIDAYCENLHNKGVRNLFVQTSRSNTEAITHPEELGILIESCHRYKIRVIAWSFAELQNPIADADKLVTAARFTSSHGQRLDAVAANMEKDLSSAKVEPYSRRLREELGPHYPLIAVVYSPLNKAPQVANIPWKLLDRYYSVIAPMNYWNSKYAKLDPYTYTVATVQKVRELVGRPDVEIHVIGDGMGTHADSIAQFMRACQQVGATSASLYPNFKVTGEQLDTIARYSEFFPVNSRFRLAALRDAIASGSLTVPQGSDPSSSISRGSFYKMVVLELGLAQQMHLNRQSVSDEKAAELLSSLGALEMARVSLPRGTSMDEAMRAQIGSQEALNVVASVVSIRTNPTVNLTLSRAKKRPDRWFTQPAYADSNRDASVKPLSFLDAAQIVVQARPGVPRS